MKTILLTTDASPETFAHRSVVLKPLRRIAMCLLFTAALANIWGCTPRVEIAPSSEPITINLNVKIEHEVRVKIEKQLEDEVFKKNDGLF